MAKRMVYSTTLTDKQWGMIKNRFPGSVAERLRAIIAAYFALQDIEFPVDDSTHGGSRRYAGRPRKRKDTE